MRTPRLLSSPLDVSQESKWPWRSALAVFFAVAAVLIQPLLFGSVSLFFASRAAAAREQHRYSAIITSVVLVVISLVFVTFSPRI